MLKKINQKTILDIITNYYLQSGDFNGIGAIELALQLELSLKELSKRLIPLIKKELISVVCDENPPIRRFKDKPINFQLEKLKDNEFQNACLYPLPKHLHTSVDPSEYLSKPYQLCLAMGTPQLEYKVFDLSLLEIYRNNPQYYYINDEISGYICVSNEYLKSNKMAESDKTFLESFGFCYDKKLNRAIAVFVRYLSMLSPEHQQLWKLKELSGDFNLHPDYYMSSILGSWDLGISVFDAFLEEMRIIIEMTRSIGKPPLFKKDFSIKRPREFGFLVRPTLKEYNDFIHLLDKMLSDNIDKNFFKGDVSFNAEEIQKDGKIRLRNKGTLTLLAEWLKKYYKPGSPQLFDDCLKTFNDVREKRHKPAHLIEDNKFDQNFIHEQRELIKKSYEALRVLRLIFSNHPKVDKSIEIDPRIEEGNIRFF